MKKGSKKNVDFFFFSQFLFGVEATIAHCATDDRVLFLFNAADIVSTVGANAVKESDEMTHIPVLKDERRLEFHYEGKDGKNSASSRWKECPSGRRSTKWQRLRPLQRRGSELQCPTVS